jgi:hypothetical protein
MSRLRPDARTTSPDGRAWEIYTYRFRLPPRRRRRLRSLLPDIVRGLRRAEWTVEAVSWAPYPVTHRWTVSRELRGQVLASVEGQLARGEHPRPRNAREVPS